MASHDTSHINIIGSRIIIMLVSLALRSSAEPECEYYRTHVLEYQWSETHVLYSYVCMFNRQISSCSDI